MDHKVFEFVEGLIRSRFASPASQSSPKGLTARAGIHGDAGDLDLATVDALRFAPSRAMPTGLPAAPAALSVGVARLGVSDALLRLGLLPKGQQADLAAARQRLRMFEESRSLPVDGDLGPEDALELAVALSAAGHAEAADRILLAARETDPEQFAHEVAWPRLARGERDSLAVAFVQARLDRLASTIGGGTITVDGHFGPATEAAVIQLQGAASLPQDGVVGEQTWLALVDGLATLRPGDTSELLKVGQQRLRELNHGDLDGTGFFGPKTLDALHSFQVESGLPVANEFNVDTWRFLLGSTAVATPDDVLASVRAELTSLMQGALDLLPAADRSRVAAVVASAIATYGIHEKPEGSNRGSEVDSLVGTEGLPWCALAVSNWLRRGLQSTSWSQIPFGERIAAVNRIRKWGFDNDRFLPAGEVPPGAILILNRRTGTATPPSQPFDIGHTGLVIVDRGETVVTIEGNSRDSVRSNQRRKSDLVGFVRWWG